MDLQRGIEDAEKIKLLARDPVTNLLGDYLASRSIAFEELMFIRNLGEKGGSVYSYDELEWIYHYHDFWLHLIKSAKGSSVFLQFYDRNGNTYRTSKELRLNRRTVMKWTDRLLKTSLMFIDPLVMGNEKFLILNKGKYRNLLFLTRWFILEEKAKKMNNAQWNTH